MKDTIIGWFIVLLMVLFVSRFIALIREMNKHHPTEPDDEAHSHARLKPRPKSDAGAVALEEPDEDDEEQP